MRPLGIPIPFLAVLLFPTSLLWGGFSYGETVTVENRLGAIISPGWVITHESYSGPRFYNPFFPTRFFMTLVQLLGAPIGATIEILGRSPIPPGWVKISTRCGTELDRQSYNIRYQIEKQIEADGAYVDLDLPPVVYVPIEVDVASMAFQRDGQLLKAKEDEERLRKPAQGGFQAELSKIGEGL